MLDLGKARAMEQISLTQSACRSRHRSLFGNVLVRDLVGELRYYHFNPVAVASDNCTASRDGKQG